MTSPIAEQVALLALSDTDSHSSPGSNASSQTGTSSTRSSGTSLSPSSPRYRAGRGTSFRQMTEIFTEPPRVSIGPNSRYLFTASWPDETARTVIVIQTPKDDKGESIRLGFQVNSIRPPSLSGDTIRYHCTEQQLQKELLRVATEALARVGPSMSSHWDMMSVNDTDAPVQHRLASAVGILETVNKQAEERDTCGEFISTCHDLDQYWQVQDLHLAQELGGLQT